MSKSAMPFLVVNYGAEMVFILEQRLHAQNVKNEKAAKVLQDVTKSMFAPQFVQELMRPQELYTPAATREIFDRLAQSSIMKLSENSMDKLYDLMTMGCKYQIISCKHPMELVELTLNHIDCVYEAVKGSVSGDHLANTNEQVMKLARTLTSGVLADVRHSLLNFYQGRRVKVSLFLNDGLQTSDGFFVLPRGGEVPTDPPVQPVGTIKYFQNGQQTLAEEFAHPDKAIVKPAPHPTNAFDASQRTTPLGRNLYISDKKKASAAPAAPAKQPAPAPTPAPVAQPPAQAAAPPSVAASAAMAKKTSFRQRSTLGGSSGTGAGLNSLSALIASAPPTDSFKVNLFDDQSAAPAAPGMDAAAAPAIEIKRVSREDMMKNNSELMGVMGNFDAGNTAVDSGNVDAGQDLLDLMDGA